MRITGPIMTAALLSVCIGCTTGPMGFLGDDNQCPAPGSDAWWAQQAALPPGARTNCYKGKNWPVQPRPTGDKQQLTQAFHSAHYWPLPYVCQDRESISQFVKAQQDTGWRQETTLYARHFNDDQTLNVPGELHLVDILEVTPLQYRTVYIQSTYNNEVDQSRQAVVQNTVNQLTGGTEQVPVVIRRGRDYSRPASEVKAINDLYINSIPTPRLSGGGSSGSAASTSGGGAGGVSAVGP